MRAFSVTDIPLWGRSLVDASAGTGKTYAIATLFLRLLLETERQPRQLLVVTFTEAATAELKERIRARLREGLAALLTPTTGKHDPVVLTLLSRAGDRQRVKRRLEKALYEFDDIEISTIHGFCQRVLLERALGSDITYGSQLFGDARPLIDEIIMDFWARRLSEGSPEFVAYLRQDGPKKFDLQAARRLAYSLQRAPQALLLPSPSDTPPPDFAAFRQTCTEAAHIWQRHDVATLIQESKIKKNPYNRRNTPNWAGRVSAFFAHDAATQFLALPDCFDRFGSAKLLAYGGTDLVDHELVLACDRVLVEHGRLRAALDADVLRYKLALLDYVQKELPRRSAAQRQLSFDDLLSRLHAALMGPAGPELARSIRERYPTALIDEFQDTDPIQLGIFERIYDAPQTSLFLIGDPKQAIYSFRGADVFSYVRAARGTSSERHYTMTTNYRSDPSLVQAVNHLFETCPHPFLLSDIGFAPVSARPGAHDVLAARDGSNASGLEILLAESGSEDALGGDWVANELPALIAREIKRTLAGEVTAAGQRLSPGDIAVLTRTNDQAFQIQAALRSIQVVSVVLGDKSVYDSAEALDLERILRAVVEPTNARLVRAALATDLIGLNAHELSRLEEDDSAWESWLSAFQSFGSTWAQTGFVHMCRQLLSRHGLEERLLGLTDGERRMTNLLQLIELLHEAGVRGHLGPSGVVQFLVQQRRGELIGMEAEGAQIRLESDADAVKITTMHRSKGLEYPVVYCPYLWAGTLLFRSDEQAPKLHTSEGQLVLDLGSEQQAEHVARARFEAFAENLRLAYVALTRARHRCTVVWGRVQSTFATSSLGYLLHPLPASERAPEVPQIQAHLSELTDEALRQGLQRHADSAAIRWRRAVAEEAALESPAAAAPTGPLRSRTPAVRIDDRHRISSFSALTSHAPEETEELMRDHDARAATPPPELEERQLGPRLRLSDFPRGAKAGSFFHDVLEHCDFAGARPASLKALVEARLKDYAYPVEQWRELVCEHLYAVLDTPLAASDAAPLRLTDISLTNRLSELEFCVPVCERNGGREPRALAARDLARVFREHPSTELHAQYAERVGRLNFIPLRGYLRGFIDLVFRHDGRFYVVDYKANHLGEHATHYAFPSLSEAMVRGQYFLQYHLYALALHRYLGRRVAGYRYEQHFGGVYYLFIKGMSPELGSSGVFFEKPPLARLDALSRVLELAQ
ncbi:MAG: helicase/exodeoxyribonuclease beta subunit [Pseudomonadota bacterium]|jgi:exodeoxyribonuclease V beta subunit